MTSDDQDPIALAWRHRAGPTATVERVEGYYLGRRFRPVAALHFRANGHEVFVEARAVGGLGPVAVVDLALEMSPVDMLEAGGVPTDGSDGATWTVNGAPKATAVPMGGAALRAAMNGMGEVKR